MSWVITLLTPFVLIMTSIRVLFAHWFLDLEYRAPGFPPDPYGFTLADRLHWGKLSMDYLFNSSGISFLADLKFADGTPIYNARELSHMLDVKNLLQVTLRLWYVALVVLVVLALVAVWRKWGRDYLQGLSRGGWLTIGLLALVLVGVGVSFSWLFTEFHRIFFTGDTWLFYYSDTLIRLFPMRLWQDAFILLGIFCIAGGLFCALVLRPGKVSKPATGAARAD
jgi:integral membrane protein (TIGR01906 family)